MKVIKSIIITMAFAIIFGICQTANAEETPVEVTIPVVPVPNPPKDKDPDPTKPPIITQPVEPGEEGRRIGAMSINCRISIHGVLLGEERVKIESFEVRDMDGNTIAIFSEEKEFISFIFSTEGDFELIFRLPSRSLHGFISL